MPVSAPLTARLGRLAPLAARPGRLAPLTARLGRLAGGLLGAAAVTAPLAACGKRGANEPPEGASFPRDYPSR
jgi:hypothetical protein